MPVNDPAARVGVEHELRVWCEEEQVDFRRALPVVAGGLRALDPGDPRARRLPSGVALTADGREAELVTPPLRWGRRAPHHLEALLAAERAELAARLAEHAGADRLTGFSTHVNVEVPDDRVVEVARRFVRYAALATAVVAEPSSSSGLLVRPRRARLEVGGEYAEGAHLVAWVTFVGSAAAALLAQRPPPDVPEPVIEPAREKFGWYLPVEGAYAELLRDPEQARELLRVVWSWARPSCLAGDVDPEPVDRLVAGAPLRCADRTTPADACSTDEHLDVPRLDGPGTGPRRLADGTTAETTWLTWSHVVWTFSAGRREVHAVLPVSEEEEFLGHLDRGELDAVVRARLRPHLRRRLLVHADLGRGRWWDVVRPGALVPAERGPDGTVPDVSRRRAGRDLRRQLSSGP